MIDYQIQFMNFPSARIKETVSENPDGSYTIFIEASLSREEQQNAFSHAMRHILGDDFEKSDINTIEAAAHNLANSKNDMANCMNMTLPDYL